VSSLVLQELLGALAGIPPLPGALCRGQWNLFDEANDPGAIEAATRTCELCPALDRCRQWVNGLPPRNRPTGVVAGQLHPLPVGRPKSNQPTMKGTP
jgi:hypothetical protein